MGQYKESSLCGQQAMGATGASIPQCNDVEPRHIGLHESFAIILQKVAQVNSLLDGVLQRVHGPRPEDPNNNAKNPETPSVKQLGDRIASELAHLESLAYDISNFVG